MKEMIYKAKRELELLDRGTYRDHEYFVLSLGTHPCAYVKLNGENPERAESVPCHGGITYNRNYLYLAEDEKIEGNFIGWDYAHYGDKVGYMDTLSLADDGEEYTTSDLVAECKAVIDELIEVYGR